RRRGRVQRPLRSDQSARRADRDRRRVLPAPLPPDLLEAEAADRWHRDPVCQRLRARRLRRPAPLAARPLPAEDRVRLHEEATHPALGERREQGPAGDTARGSGHPRELTRTIPEPAAARGTWRDRRGGGQWWPADPSSSFTRAVRSSRRLFRTAIRSIETECPGASMCDRISAEVVATSWCSAVMVAERLVTTGARWAICELVCEPSNMSPATATKTINVSRILRGDCHPLMPVPPGSICGGVDTSRPFTSSLPRGPCSFSSASQYSFCSGSPPFADIRTSCV